MTCSIFKDRAFAVPALLLALCLSLSVALVLPAAARMTPNMDDQGDPEGIQSCQTGEEPSGASLLDDNYVSQSSFEDRVVVESVQLVESSRYNASARPIYVPVKVRLLVAAGFILFSLGFRF